MTCSGFGPAGDPLNLGITNAGAITLGRTGQNATVNSLLNPSATVYAANQQTVLASGIMNEQQAKAYFGWTPSSKMLATYAHLLTSDANNAILAEHHLTPQAQHSEGLTTIPCPPSTLRAA